MELPLSNQLYLYCFAQNKYLLPSHTEILDKCHLPWKQCWERKQIETLRQSHCLCQSFIKRYLPVTVALSSTPEPLPPSGHRSNEEPSSLQTLNPNVWLLPSVLKMPASTSLCSLVAFCSLKRAAAWDCSPETGRLVMIGGAAWWLRSMVTERTAVTAGMRRVRHPPTLDLCLLPWALLGLIPNASILAKQLYFIYFVI